MSGTLPEQVSRPSPDLAVAVEQAVREASALRALLAATLARRLGINPTDLECLDIIAARQGVSAGEVAELTGLTTGAITGVLDRLERRGLAERRRDVGDRRRIQIFPTSSAVAALERYRGPGPVGAEAGGASRELSAVLGYFTRLRASLMTDLNRLVEANAGQMAKAGRTEGAGR